MFYNLLMSGDDTDWKEPVLEFPLGRFLEHTDEELKAYFKCRSRAVLDELIEYPCVFAYESGCGRDPHLGKLETVTVRNSEFRCRFKITQPEFITLKKFEENALLLDIAKFEYNRTHWAIKRVDLGSALAEMGEHSLLTSPTFNLGDHAFPVALSFPGEHREYVRRVAEILVEKQGREICFYDENFKAQLARPSLDLYLQEIYTRAKLNVVFISKHYQDKQWCSGVEWRAIREIITQRENDRVMFVRFDDAEVDGVRSTDGYIDAREHDETEVASFIRERMR